MAKEQETTEEEEEGGDEFIKDQQKDMLSLLGNHVPSDVEEEEEEEVGDEEETLESLKAKHEEALTRLRAELLAKKEKVEEDVEPPKAPSPITIDDDDAFEAIMESREKFNAFVQNLVTATREQVLQSIPTLVGQTVARQTTLKSTVDQFYKDNADLLPHMKYVGYIANEVQSEHADWSVPQVLEEASKRSRTNLNLAERAAKIEKDQQDNKAKESRKPTFAKTPGGQREVAKTVDDSQKGQIASLLGLNT